MLSLLFSKRKASNTNCCLGISFDTERVSVAVTQKTEDGFTIQNSHSARIETSLGDSLKQVCKQIGAPNCKANISLSIEDSIFHKIQKPNVPVEERDSSALFLMKDRLKQSVEETLLATIEYPEGCRHDDQLMAIEVKRSRVEEIIHAVQDAGIEINAIDVMELNLGEILAFDEDMGKGVALLVEHENGVSLLLYRDHALYLIRRIQDIPDLVGCLPAPGNAHMADMLLLEVQRTLDYYDSLMSQPAPGHLLLAPSFVDLKPLAEHLDANLGPRVDSLDLNAIFEMTEPLDTGAQKDALGAIAASLREAQ